MENRIIVLNSGVDKKEIADTSCCPTRIVKVSGE
jgi:hypothetical protein